MEALGAVSAVVQVAILLSDKVLIVVNKQAHRNESTADVKQLRAWLSLFQSFIRDAEGKPQENHVSRDLVKKVVDVTADIEDALDEFMFAVPIHLHGSRIVQAISDAKHRVTDIKPVKELANQRERIKKKIDGQRLQEQLIIKEYVGSRKPKDPLCHQFLVEDEIVGFTKRRDDLRNQLTSLEEKKRAMIQVVGPGGSGKTFLVKKVFRDLNITRGFQCLAWIDMTRSFNADDDREIWLEDLLKQVCLERDRPILYEARNKEQMLHRYLKDKRYLIVLDNVWKKQQYTRILNVLPNNYCGSKIIITTRNSSITDNPNYTHKLDGLIEEEAMNLFCAWAFKDQQNNACPPNLKKVSEKILERCEGMPLAIGAVGSLLSKEQLTEREWEKFNDRVGSELRSNSIVGSILQPSILDLPYNLRSCFLYFSVFPEDEPVSRGRLIRSWMAEGFLNQTDSERPEEAAESYLNELIKRSLVRVNESETDGRVKSCQLLRLHHEFIVPLSEEGNFVTVIGRKPGKVTSDVKFRRLSVQSDNFPTKLFEINDLMCVRTLFVFGTLDEVSPKNSSFRSQLKSRIKGMWRNDELEKVFAKFKLLKVLDLQGVPLQKLPNVVGSFLLLRCLNLRNTELETIPSSLENLTLLETLDLKRTRVRKLPKWIKKLQNLRHLVVSWFEDSSNVVEGVMVSSASIGTISSLQTLSLVKVNNPEGFSIEDLGLLTQLKKLGVVDLDEDCGKKLCKAIEKMESLSKFDVRSMVNKHLELDHLNKPPTHIRSLRLEGLSRRLPSWISKLSSLVKVVLKGSKLQENAFEGLEDLPSLKELEMVEYYTGQSLKFKAGKFLNLRKLHVEQFDNLTQVVVENPALSLLESLTICKCRNLRPIIRSYPLGRLNELVVYEMSDAFINDIQRRIDENELVYHIQKGSSNQNRGEIRSFRHVS